MLLIRVEPEQDRLDLPELVPQTEGSAPYLLGIDAELLYGEQLIEDKQLGGRGFLVNYSPFCFWKGENTLDLFYTPQGTSESLWLVLN